MIHLTRTKSFLWLFNVSVAAVLLMGCQNEKTEKPKEEEVRLTKDMLVKKYDYIQDLEVYLKENIDENLVLNPIDTLLFVPMNSCASCVSYTFNALSVNPFSGKIIIGGNPDDYDQYEPYIANVAEKNPGFYIDSSSSMYDYRIGVSGPTMLLKSADQWKIIELSIATWPMVIELIHWKSPDFDFSKH